MSHYIGVTGFMTQKEISAALSAMPRPERLPFSSGERVNAPRSHELMIGILASWKSLRGIALKSEWQKRYPKNIQEIKRLFVSARKLASLDDFNHLNLIHYSCGKNIADLESDLRFIKRKLGSCFDGFQLNIPWPDPKVLKKCLSIRDQLGNGDIVILQIGQKALEMVHHDPQEAVSRLQKYKDIITGILFDPSGGKGKAFDLTEARKFLYAIAEGNNDLTLGVAGGLCADTLSIVRLLLVAETFHVSIDAEGRLRNKDGDMDIDAMKKYISEAFKMVYD